MNTEVFYFRRKCCIEEYCKIKTGRFSDFKISFNKILGLRLLFVENILPWHGLVRPFILLH